MSLEPLRHSALKRIGQSPAHFAAHLDASAKWLDKGSGAHSAILGGKRLVTWDKKSEAGNQCPRRGKDWDAFNAENRDALILLPDEYEQVQRIAEAVHRCPEAVRVLQGVRETTVFWDVLGRPCRGTPDVDGGDFVTELKTTKCADPEVFWRDSRRYCYHGALAWYMDGLAMQRGRKEMPEAAFVVAVESALPYAVTVFRMPERALTAGRRANRAWLERLLVCEASNEFPPYSQSVVEMYFPEDEPTLVFGEEEAA
jgi:hypothetical protein